MCTVGVWSVPTLVRVRLTGTCVVTILVHVGPDTRTRVAGLAWWRCRLQMAPDCRWPHGAAASKMERDASAAAAAAVAAAATPVAAAPAHSTSGAAAAATAAACALAFAAAVEEIARESSAAQLLLLAQRFGQREERARTPWMVLQVLALGRQWECMQTAPPTAAQMPAYAKGLQAHGQPPMLLNARPACPPACLPACSRTHSRARLSALPALSVGVLRAREVAQVARPVGLGPLPAATSERCRSFPPGKGTER